ncbi:putative polygalacturonase [Rosa chinensis]|uniref:Putative polygalacturonase n=1 Tax=Rosa chinensis TaxID=74649 RepID=A0A2P6RRD9_ROSCH|nr:putative polygalacturonase [Rosa chinensis]
MGCCLCLPRFSLDKCTKREIDGTLVASPDYRVLGQANNWLGFEGVSGVTIIGGTLDAKGSALWACKLSTKASNCPDGATGLSFTNSKNIRVEGLMSLNSHMYHIVINGCQDVLIQGVKVIAAGNSPNSDGIHVQFSKFIGSLAKDLEEEGVQNVTVKNAIFKGTQNGVRIKSWARRSNGFVQGVQFLDVEMIDVQNPIVIDQNYCPHNLNCPAQVSGVKISDVLYQNIRGTSATAVAVKFTCSAANPCSGIRLENVNLACRNQVVESYCTNAIGKTFGTVQPTSCL